MSARFAAFVAGSLLFISASAAFADPMDPALERLVTNPECRNDFGIWNDGGGRCFPDNAAFKKLINQYGFALAPSAMHSARTTGYGGFHLSLEAAYTKISDGEDYWERGTQGPTDPSTNRSSIRNNSPQSLLQLYSAKIRKGFGFGLEITGSVGFMPKTNIISGGADVRMSLLEGFRTGALGILPDLAVGGGVRTVTGTPQFQLTTVGLDVQISKPLPIQDSSVITPWVGYQFLWIFGDSGLVDLTPGTDALNYCNYAGSNVPGNSDPRKKTGGGQDVHDGQPVCAGGSPLDFNNNVVFNQVRLERHRLLAGLNYRYEMVMAGAQLITDLIPPEDAQSDDQDKQDLAGESRQWTIVLELGTMF